MDHQPSTMGDPGFAFSTALLSIRHLNTSPRKLSLKSELPASEPSVTCLFQLSHPPPAGKYEFSTGPFWRVVTEHCCITSQPYPIPARMPKIATIHVLQHGQKRHHLESGFPPSPSWEAGDCSHPPPMAHREWITFECNITRDKQRVLMHRHQGWNVRHGLCHIYMRYLYIYELFIAFVCFVVCSLL